jgi:hypothetical protein
VKPALKDACGVSERDRADVEIRVATIHSRSVGQDQLGKTNWARPSEQDQLSQSQQHKRPVPNQTDKLSVLLAANAGELTESAWYFFWLGTNDGYLCPTGSERLMTSFSNVKQSFLQLDTMQTGRQNGPISNRKG